MVEKSLSEKLQTASKDTLTEILRPAESHLNAQLTSAIAADQRAYTFAGLTSASAIILLGGTYSALTAIDPDRYIAIIAFFVAVSLFVASWMAVVSARPMDFDFPASRPGTWVEDVEKNTTFELSLAEQCANYDESINSNRATMDKNSRLFNWATNVALASVGSGAVALLIWIGQALKIG